MKAALIFTGTGPILILTTHRCLDHPELVARLAAKGIAKFVAHEIPVTEVHRWYGAGFEKALADRTQDNVLRVLDVDGKHIFCHLHLDDLGPAVLVEPVAAPASA